MNVNSDPKPGWREVNGPKGLWFAGIFAVVDTVNHRLYFVEAGNVGKRLWDQMDLLDRGAHHNAALQADWSARRRDFKLYLVERSKNRPKWLVRFRKQQLIDAAAASAGGCYNVKSSVRRPQRRPHPGPTQAPSTAMAPSAAAGATGPAPAPPPPSGTVTRGSNDDTATIEQSVRAAFLRMKALLG